MINILVIGRHADIMETVLRLCNSQTGWQEMGALTDGEALELFSNNSFDVVLIGGGVDEQSETVLTAKFRERNPSIRVVRHYGGGSGLLYAEIFEAIKK